MATTTGAQNQNQGKSIYAGFISPLAVWSCAPGKGRCFETREAVPRTVLVDGEVLVSALMPDPGEESLQKGVKNLAGLQLWWENDQRK